MLSELKPLSIKALAEKAELPTRTVRRMLASNGATFQSRRRCWHWTSMMQIRAHFPPLIAAAQALLDGSE